MTKADRAAEAFEIHQKIQENEKYRRLLLAKNTELLNEVFEKEYFKDLLGDDEAEWAGYLGEMELFYSRNQIHTYTRIYRKLTLELGVPADIWVEAPISRLYDILPVLTKQNYDEWLAAAVSLTGRDWNIEVRKAKGLINEETDKHVHEDVLYEICRTCGRRHKVNHEAETQEE